MKPETPQSEQAFNLPPPSHEYDQQLSGLDSIDSFPQGEAAANMALEQGVSGMPNDNQLPPLPVPPMPPADPSLTVPITTTAHGMPLIADDADLIEKEWVEKAKQIVEHTKHDPYLQNKEINRVKADYLKKRYNKDLTISDDQ